MKIKIFNIVEGEFVISRQFFDHEEAEEYLKNKYFELDPRFVDRDPCEFIIVP
jgi:hypothetical protein